MGKEAGGQEPYKQASRSFHPADTVIDLPGVDGIIIEVHNDPEHALCDGEQSVTPDSFAALMESLRGYAALEGKTI